LIGAAPPALAARQQLEARVQAVRAALQVPSKEAVPAEPLQPARSSGKAGEQAHGRQARANALCCTADRRLRRLAACHKSKPPLTSQARVVTRCTLPVAQM
jgi:hypothetical protein